MATPSPSMASDGEYRQGGRRFLSTQATPSMAAPPPSMADGQLVRRVRTKFDRKQVDLVWLLSLKEELGFGLWDYYYYKKRIGNANASVLPIDSTKDVECLLEKMKSSEERNLRLIISKQEVVGAANITPLKRPRVNESNDVSDADDDSSNDRDVDEYKDWLDAQDPECGLYDEYRDDTIKAYSKWLRHKGLLRDILAYNRGQEKPTEVREENNGGKKVGRGCLKGLAAVAKRSKSGLENKLKIEFFEKVGGPCGDNRCTFVDEVVLYTKQKTPIIGPPLLELWKTTHTREGRWTNQLAESIYVSTEC
uniref:Uncharacterized protein n=1 Tax=Setaria viridis TaxID=4556 RepID=A0A4U6SZX0_SETVI|nr:hypothetical protein SEVIR_9G275500v2 [Setaria viridis]